MQLLMMPLFFQVDLELQRTCECNYMATSTVVYCLDLLPVNLNGKFLLQYLTNQNVHVQCLSIGKGPFSSGRTF